MSAFAPLGRHFWATAYLALVLGFVVPGDWRWVAPAIPWALGGILFFTGLKLRLLERRPAATPAAGAPLPLLLALKLIVLPLIAWVLCLLLFPAWAPGVLLVGLMPAGLSTIALTDLAGGDHRLGLRLVLATSLLAPLTVPLLLAAAGVGHVAPTALLAQTGYILFLLATPLIASELLHRVAPQRIAAHSPLWGRLAIGCLCLLVFVSVAGRRDAWTDWKLIDLLPGLLAVTLASAVFLGASLLVWRRWGLRGGVAFACAAVYMNNGLGVAFSSRFFSDAPTMLLPAVLMQVPMVAGVALIARWARRSQGSRLEA
jgi:BASS family bile acid:Na+ symporter